MLYGTGRPTHGSALFPMASDCPGFHMLFWPTCMRRPVYTQSVSLAGARFAFAMTLALLSYSNKTQHAFALALLPNSVYSVKSKSTLYVRSSASQRGASHDRTTTRGRERNTCVPATIYDSSLAGHERRSLGVIANAGDPAAAVCAAHLGGSLPS